jgi:hypothetical protein
MHYFEIYDSISIIVFICMFWWSRSNEDAQKWSIFARGFVIIFAAIAWPAAIAIFIIMAVGKLSQNGGWQSLRR